jgi:hypothetical protein
MLQDHSRGKQSRKKSINFGALTTITHLPHICRDKKEVYTSRNDQLSLKRKEGIRSEQKVL